MVTGKMIHRGSDPDHENYNNHTKHLFISYIPIWACVPYAQVIAGSCSNHCFCKF